MSTTFEPQSKHRKTFSMNDMESEKEFTASSFSTTNLGLTCVLNERNIQGRVSKDKELWRSYNWGNKGPLGYSLTDLHELEETAKRYNASTSTK